MAVGRQPVRLELAEASHKIKSAKMRSRAEMKVALQTLDRQMRIARVSSDMQQARMREHLEDLLLIIRRPAAEAIEATADRRTHSATAAQRSREPRPVVAPSLSEEHAFRERLLKRLQMLHCMRLPSNYSKRLLSDEEQTVIDLAETPSPENERRALAESGRRLRSSSGKALSPGLADAPPPPPVYAKVNDSVAAAAEPHGARQASVGGAPGKEEDSCSGDGGGGGGVADTPTPRPSPLGGGARGRSGVARGGGGGGLPGQSTRRGLPSGHTSSTATKRLVREGGGGGGRGGGDRGGGSVSETQQRLLAERQRRFYDSLRALRRLSIGDLLVGLRRLAPAADASRGERREEDDDVDELTLHKEYRELLGYCRRSATSLTWKSLANAL